MVTCAFGLEGLLQAELIRLGLERPERSDGSVSGAGDWSLVRRANLGLRTGRRVLVDLADWWAHDLRALYEGAADLVERDPGIAALLDPSLSFGVYATTSDSDIRSPGAASDAVVDGLLAGQRARGGRLSRVVRRGADLPLRIRVHRNQAILLLDTSGAALDDRPGRAEVPVRNTVAGALAEVAGPRDVVFDPWPEESNALDEWFERAGRRGPNVDRAHWPFERLPGHDAATFARERAALRGAPPSARVLETWEDVRGVEGGLLIGCPPEHWESGRWQAFGARIRRELRGWRVVVLARGRDGERGLRLKPGVRRRISDGRTHGTIVGLDLWSGAGW